MLSDGEFQKEEVFCYSDDMFVVIQLVISHNERGSSACPPAREQTQALPPPPLPEKLKIHIGALFSKWGLFFLY